MDLDREGLLKPAKERAERAVQAMYPEKDQELQYVIKKADELTRRYYLEYVTPPRR